MLRTHAIALSLLPFVLTGCASVGWVPTVPELDEIAGRGRANVVKMRELREIYPASSAPEAEQIETQWKALHARGTIERDRLDHGQSQIRRFGKGYTHLDHARLSCASSEIEIGLRREELMMHFAQAERFASADPARARRHFEEAGRFDGLDRDGKLGREWERVWAIVHAGPPAARADGPSFDGVNR